LFGDSALIETLFEERMKTGGREKGLKEETKFDLDV